MTCRYNGCRSIGVNPIFSIQILKNLSKRLHGVSLLHDSEIKEMSIQ
ncbi:9796_t:CDS:1, partial [Entrophospora sp. SA101]